MFAIIETGGKQYKVAVGDYLNVELLDVNEKDAITFDKVSFVSKDGGETSVGAPYVDGASVVGTVVKNGRGKKITIFTYKPKKASSHKKQGHRQPFTTVKIDEIKI
ncbi:MAG: 50S ribosomal protein L21 [Ruminococcus sp.]|jgi:large subunit ribosomal protein L21|nr:50S ribosomal protein L21 [Ruminococcus sp.]